MYLANLAIPPVQDWQSLGGFTLLVICLLGAIKWLVKQNEELISKLEAKETAAQNKLDEERRRLEGKWDLERRENLDHREKDRETRDKLADAVQSLASAVNTK